VFGTDVSIRYDEKRGEYHLSANKITEQMRTTYGTSRLDGLKLADMLLNGRKPEVYSMTDDRPPKRFLDVEATAAAQDQANKIQNEFRAWAKVGDQKTNDGDFVGDVLEKAFNDQHNGHVAAKYKGEWLQLPGLNKEIKPYPHQLSVVSRMLQEQCGVIAHGVGFGKTYELIISAMESRRMGIFRKPVVVVQKATVGQFASSFRKAYPAARILVANEHTFSAKNRKAFFSKIAVNDWDAVIVTQPQFDEMESDPKVMSAYIKGLIRELDVVIGEKRKDDDATSVRQLEKSKDRLEQKLERLKDRLKNRQDNAIYFESMGIDALFIDEAHA
jgi:N12 class adenine-specific DNA methylase